MDYSDSETEAKGPVKGPFSPPSVRGPFCPPRKPTLELSNQTRPKEDRQADVTAMGERILNLEQQMKALKMANVASAIKVAKLEKKLDSLALGSDGLGSDDHEALHSWLWRKTLGLIGWESGVVAQHEQVTEVVVEKEKISDKKIWRNVAELFQKLDLINFTSTGEEMHRVQFNGKRVVMLNLHMELTMAALLRWKESGLFQDCEGEIPETVLATIHPIWRSRVSSSPPDIHSFSPGRPGWFGGMWLWVFVEDLDFFYNILYYCNDDGTNISSWQLQNGIMLGEGGTFFPLFMLKNTAPPPFVLRVLRAFHRANCRAVPSWVDPSTFGYLSNVRGVEEDDYIIQEFWKQPLP